jgi:hypothetical protein
MLSQPSPPGRGRALRCLRAYAQGRLHAQPRGRLGGQRRTILSLLQACQQMFGQLQRTGLDLRLGAD